MVTDTNDRERQREGIDAAAVERALRGQADPEADDLSLIRARLRWTPEERLEANASFVRFCLTARPQGPLLRD
ncbi:MAG: hypothetical protein ACRD3M_07450 [Thermoanaerobaculia bacterium]